MYSISNRDRDVFIQAIELLRRQPIKGNRDYNLVRMATLAARTLKNKKPMEEK